MKVLVVDDVELNQRLLTAAISDLCDEGVLVAERATKAIELAIANIPDLIFMDIGLPDFDGLEATRLIKSNPLLSHIPIVIVSAHARPEYFDLAKRVGCERYITKPVSISAVRDVVKRHLQRESSVPSQHNHLVCPSRFTTSTHSI